MNDETQSRLETLEAIVTAQTIVLTALIQTHPRHEDWQLIWPELAQAEAAGVAAGGEGGDV